MSSQLSYEDWVYLAPESRVLVQRQGEGASAGSVDDVTEDASCFWVWLDGGRGRVLVSEGDGSTVWDLARDPIGEPVEAGSTHYPGGESSMISPIVE